MNVDVLFYPFFRESDEISEVMIKYNIRRRMSKCISPNVGSVPWGGCSTQNSENAIIKPRWSIW